MKQKNKPESKRVTRRFAAGITQARRLRGLSQREAAHHADVSSTLVSMIERRLTTVPTDATLGRLATALGMASDEMFALADKVPMDLRAIITSDSKLYAPLLRMARMADRETVLAATEAMRDSIKGNRG